MAFIPTVSPSIHTVTILHPQVFMDVETSRRNRNKVLHTAWNYYDINELKGCVW